MFLSQHCDKNIKMLENKS